MSSRTYSLLGTQPPPPTRPLDEGLYGVGQRDVHGDHAG